MILGLLVAVGVVGGYFISTRYERTPLLKRLQRMGVVLVLFFIALWFFESMRVPLVFVPLIALIAGLLIGDVVSGLRQSIANHS